MTTHNPKFKGTPGPWRVDGHIGGNGVANYSIVSISGDAVGCAPVAEVLRNNPRPMPEQRIEANARLLAAAETAQPTNRPQTTPNSSNGCTSDWSAPTAKIRIRTICRTSNL